MTPVIRLAQARDLHPLVDIDLKSYDYPWSVDKWRKFVTDPTCMILLASFKVEPVGMCIWQKKLAIKEAEILRIATKPAYRGKGAGIFLLHGVETGAKEHGLEKVTVIVPEIKCFPGYPDDVSQWLLNRGYKAITPILKDHFYMFGGRCDGFKFVKYMGEKHA
jgi:GNAT superfamily N-acetyltransferase